MQFIYESEIQDFPTQWIQVHDYLNYLLAEDSKGESST